MTCRAPHPDLQLKALRSFARRFGHECARPVFTFNGRWQSTDSWRLQSDGVPEALLFRSSFGTMTHVVEIRQ